MSKSRFPVALHDFSKPSGDAEDYVFNTEGPSLTRQEFKDECDINALMSRYEGHVVGGPGNLPPPYDPRHYPDLTSVPSNLLEFMDLMQVAENAFMSLPATVRREFDNDPVMFVDFASDKENLPQMRTWGLAPPEKAEERPAPAVSPQAPAPPSAAPAPGGAPPTHGST